MEKSSQKTGERMKNNVLFVFVSGIIIRIRFQNFKIEDYGIVQKTIEDYGMLSKEKK